MGDYMFQQLGYTNTFDLKTTVTESTITHTTTDPWGRIVEEVMDTKEKATRDALLGMGWLPPEEAKALLDIIHSITLPQTTPHTDNVLDILANLPVRGVT